MKKRRYKYKRDIYKFSDSDEYEYTALYNYGAKGERRKKRKKPTPEQMARQNQINRENKMRRLLKANFKRGDWWMTLNYPKGTRKSMEEVREDLGKFTRNVAAAYKRRGYQFKWVYRIEVGEQGGVHIHMVCNRIPDSDLILMKRWKKYGTINYKHIYEKGGMKKLANYIVKQPTEEIYEQLSLFPRGREEAFDKVFFLKKLSSPKAGTEKAKEYSKRIAYGRACADEGILYRQGIRSVWS